MFLVFLRFSTESITGRKTEEGFFIFKEAELNIRPESGGKSRFIGSLLGWAYFSDVFHDTLSAHAASLHIPSE
jgi:hypothetical protein